MTKHHAKLLTSHSIGADSSSPSINSSVFNRSAFTMVTTTISNPMYRFTFADPAAHTASALQRQLHSASAAFRQRSNGP